MVKDLIKASGYGFDIAVVRRLERDRSTYTGYAGVDVHEMHIYQGTEFGIPLHYDADSYESVRPGESRGNKTWVYGHSGFDVLNVDSVGVGSEKRYLKSDVECFELFYDDLVGGYLNKVLPRLPKIGSEEEMRLWLAAAGK